jgi:hypothetical protein
VSFAAITLYVASQRMFVVVVVYFVIDSVRKLLDTPSYSQSDMSPKFVRHTNFGVHCQLQISLTSVQYFERCEICRRREKRSYYLPVMRSFYALCTK